MTASRLQLFVLMLHKVPTNFTHAFYLSSVVPSASPGNVTVLNITSHSVSLMWLPPARQHQNGIIIGYIINVTVEETGEMYQLYSNTTNITATLTPFTMYTMVITAENSVGTGPYTEVVSIQSEEAGNNQ